MAFRMLKNPSEEIFYEKIIQSKIKIDNHGMVVFARKTQTFVSRFLPEPNILVWSKQIVLKPNPIPLSSKLTYPMSSCLSPFCLIYSLYFIVRLCGFTFVWMDSPSLSSSPPHLSPPIPPPYVVWSASLSLWSIFSLSLFSFYQSVLGCCFQTPHQR